MINRNTSTIMHRYSKMKCINCGKLGHSYKICREPKTSFGIIAIHLDNIDQSIKKSVVNYLSGIKDIPEETGIVCENSIALQKFVDYKKAIKLLLIMRKHTLGYMEFIKGRYNLQMPERIVPLFEQMTPYEIQKIKNHVNDFEYLWNDVWSITKDDSARVEQLQKLISTRTPSPETKFLSQSQSPSPDNVTKEFVHDNMSTGQIDERTSHNIHTQNKSIRFKYPNKKQDYEQAKAQFMKLNSETPINLNAILKTTKLIYDFPEWGFPKGKRSGTESDIECAKREFGEETGYVESDYILFDNIHPIVENIIGLNGMKYKYIYYIALLKSDKEPSKDTRKSQKYEIGDIGLLNYDSALTKIRLHHDDRRIIVHNVCVNLLKYIVSTIQINHKYSLI